jgi:hypothetical protein
LEGKIFKRHPNSLFEDGIGPGIEPVDGEFQVSFESAYPVGGAIFFRITFYFRLKRKLSIRGRGMMSMGGRQGV